MRKSVWLFSIIVLGICVWIVLHRRNELMRGQLQSTVSNQPLENQSATSQSTQQNASPIINVSPAKIISQPTPDARSQQAIASWNTPIEFYGKVIDENSNPVAGATINFRWATQTEDVSATTATTESDLDGLFSLQGKRGRSLDVSVGKVGYYNSRRDKTGFLYALASDIYSPDRMNPVVFHLYKKGKGEALIEKDFPPGIGQIWQLRHDGTLIELDLLNGTQVSAGNGQLKLEFLRDISNMNVRPFDWKLQITAVGGGLVPTDEEFAFQAPESGYQPSVVIDMPATNQDWLGELRTKYYIQLPNGDYGRFDFYLLPRNGAFTVHSAINPSGSRNLEPAQ